MFGTTWNQCSRMYGADNACLYASPSNYSLLLNQGEPLNIIVEEDMPTQRKLSRTNERRFGGVRYRKNDQNLWGPRTFLCFSPFLLLLAPCRHFGEVHDILVSLARCLIGSRGVSRGHAWLSCAMLLVQNHQARANPQPSGGHVVVWRRHGLLAHKVRG